MQNKAKIFFVVTYFDPEERTVPETHWHDIYHPRQLMAMLFQSAKHFNPNAEFVVLTDQFTPLEFKIPVKVIRFDLNRHYLINSIFKAKLEYLFQHDFSYPLVFLDYDILIAASLMPLFEETFDIGLTFRSHVMPINNGVCFIHAHSQKPAQSFFEKAFDLMQLMPKEKKQWNGDQIAVYSLIEKAFLSRSRDLILVDEMNIRLFPCEKYNCFYFPHPNKTINDEIEGKVILHFKSSRKPLMKHYFDVIMH